MIRKPFPATVFVSLCFLAFVIGCDSSNDPVPTPCLITSVSETISNGDVYVYGYSYVDEVATSTSTQYPGPGGLKDTRPYIYDDAGNLIAIGELTKAHDEFTYTDGNITKSVRYSGIGQMVQTDFEYDMGKLVKIQYYNTDGTVPAYKTGYDTFEYGSSSNLDPIRRKYFDTAVSSVPTNIVDISYDDVKCPFSAAPTALVKYFRLGGQAVEKCVSKIVSTDGTSANYTYEFNEAGLPSKRTESYSNGQVNVRFYEYACR